MKTVIILILLVCVELSYVTAFADGPTITAGPNSRTNIAGTSASFDVSVSGTGPFTYQWQFNGTNMPGGIITTVAGNGANVSAGDGGRATNAAVNLPVGLAIDPSGNIFVAETVNRVRKIGADGIISTVAGTGNPANAFSGDGGYATNARVAQPIDVKVDAAGNIFFADCLNQRIRKIGTNGIITTVAGNGVSGYSADGVAATNAALQFPNALALDRSGNLFIGDWTYRIRKVGADGVITTVAGTGIGGHSGDGGPATNAKIGAAESLHFDTSGNLFFVSFGEFNLTRIRKIDTNGIITTVAGNGAQGYSGDGGPATNAPLFEARSAAVDFCGSIFIASQGDVNSGPGTHYSSIRKVATNGIITKIAGNSSIYNGYAGDGGLATNALLNSPRGITVDANGNLHFSDSLNNRIRKITRSFNDPSLVLNNVTPANAGNYSVVISSAGGSVTSSVASLTVIYPLTPVGVTGFVRRGTDAWTLSYTGGSGLQYVLLASPTLSAPISEWSRLLTNSFSPGTFNLPSMGSSGFYSVKSE